jgi:hypothetical protein
LRHTADCSALAISSRHSDGTTAPVFATWRITASARSVRASSNNHANVIELSMTMVIDSLR